MRIILVYNFCHTVHCHAPQAASRRQPASCPLKEPLCCHRPCQALCLLLRWTPLARPPLTPPPPPAPRGGPGRGGGGCGAAPPPSATGTQRAAADWGCWATPTP